MQVRKIPLYNRGTVHYCSIFLGEQRNPPGLRIGDGSPMGDSHGAAGGNPQSSRYYSGIDIY